MHHESCAELFSVSERSPVVFQNLDGLNVYTQVPQRAPASCTTFLLCLCKSFKELFLQCLAQKVFERKRMQRYDFFPNLQTFPRLFSINIQKNRKELTNIKYKNHDTFLYYIEARGKKQEARNKRWEVRDERWEIRDERMARPNALFDRTFRHPWQGQQRKNKTRQKLEMLNNPNEWAFSVNLFGTFDKWH